MPKRRIVLVFPLKAADFIKRSVPKAHRSAD
jgi:hypothetical protein